MLELDRREISKLEMSKKIRPWFVLWQLKFGLALEGSLPGWRLETPRVMIARVLLTSLAGSGSVIL